MNLEATGVACRLHGVLNSPVSAAHRCSVVQLHHQRAALAVRDVLLRTQASKQNGAHEPVRTLSGALVPRHKVRVPLLLAWCKGLRLLFTGMPAVLTDQHAHVLGSLCIVAVGVNEVLQEELHRACVPAAGVHARKA